MTEMRSSHRLAAVVALSLAFGSGRGHAETPTHLSHRLWILGELPPAADMQTLRSAGISGLAIPIGSVEIGTKSSNLTLANMQDLTALAGWSVTSLVWIQGSGKAAGDAAGFVTQLAPVTRGSPRGGGLLLVARQYAEGIPVFASAVARKLGSAVELALPAADLAAHLPPGGWEGVTPVAVGLGSPDRVGFPGSNRQDDLMAIDQLSESATGFRVAIPVASRATPPAGPGAVSLATVAANGIARYSPGARGDVFRLEKAVDWGGTRLEPGQQVELELLDTVRYNRDVADLLRPARVGFLGFDTVGLPAVEPTLGMSRQAFVDYLTGGTPYPRPTIEGQWSGSTLRLTLSNPGPQASAPATTGNWVELQPIGAVIGDILLGDFTGVEYGRWESGVFKRTNAREALVVRFYVTVVFPYGRISGGSVSFVGRPGRVLARWGMRLGDGSDITAPWQPLP